MRSEGGQKGLNRPSLHSGACYTPLYACHLPHLVTYGRTALREPRACVLLIGDSSHGEMRPGVREACIPQVFPGVERPGGRVMSSVQTRRPSRRFPCLGDHLLLWCCRHEISIHTWVAIRTSIGLALVHCSQRRRISLRRRVWPMAHLLDFSKVQGRVLRLTSEADRMN